MFYRRAVAQLSLFSAEARAPRVADLGGLLCGPGQIARFGAGDTARLSVVLGGRSAEEPWRSAALVAACAATGIAAETFRTESGATAVRTAFRRDLVELAAQWTRGAVKTVPAGMQLDGAVLRLWALAAGRPDERGGYVLGLDPHAPQTHLPLVAAATRVALPPARVGRGQGLRIGGTRRMRRLVELVGPAPQGVPAAEWPRYWGRTSD